MSRGWKLPAQGHPPAPWSRGILGLTSTLVFPTPLRNLMHYAL